MGDLCVALPALRVVRRAHPDARLTMLTNFPVSAKAAPAPLLLNGIGLVDEFLAYPVGARHPVTLGRLAWRLRGSRFAMVVNLTEWRGAWATRRDAAFFALCGIRRRVGFAPSETGGMPADAEGRCEPEAARLLRRVARLGSADLGDRRWFELALTEAERTRARACLAAGGGAPGGIAFSVGTKIAVNDWEQANWVRLLTGLAPDFPAHTCIAVGAAEEADRAAEIQRAWRGPRLNLCGQLPPRISAAVLEQAALFVGHDSGPMHLAAAVGTPVVAIFSGRHRPGRWHPLGEGHEVLSHPVACAGCGLDVCTQEGKRCILGVPVAAVAAAVRRRLGRAPAGGTLQDPRVAGLRT